MLCGPKLKVCSGILSLIAVILMTLLISDDFRSDGRARIDYRYFETGI